MLNFFSQLPNSVKVVIGFFLLGLAVAGLLNLSDLSSFSENPNDNIYVDVQILVQTDDNQPVQDAKVQFISRGAPTTKYTTSSGYTEIEIPSRESVEINISKDGYMTLVEIINLEVDPDRNKKFKLQEEESSDLDIDLTTFTDYQYYTSKHEFIPLILSSLNPDLSIPIVSEVLDHIGIDEIPLVAQNLVFETIERFKEESGNSLTLIDAINNDRYYQLGVSSQKQDSSSASIFISDDEEIKEYSNDSVSSGMTQALSLQPGEDELCFFRYAPVIGSFQTNEQDSEYTSFIQSEYGKENGYASIVQFPTFSDIAQTFQKDYDSFRCNDYVKDLWITNLIDQNPDSRGFLGFRYEFIFDPENHFQGCGISWEIEKITPSPYVKFLDLINNGDTPIRIEGINYKSINRDPYEITPADVRSQLFDSSSVVTENLNVSLRPGNHFLVPIEFGFSSEPEKLRYRQQSDMERSSIEDTGEIYVRKPVTESEWESVSRVSYEERNGINMTPVGLSESFIENTNLIRDLLELIPDRFAIGPILNVDSFKINGQNISIFPPSDEPTVYISTLLEGGSCPYLLVYDPNKDVWIELGTILYARNNKSLQHEEIHGVFNGMSKVRIEEREPEITYLDSVSITFRQSETNVDHEIIYPLDELQKSDGNYLVLNQGDSLEFDFSDFVPPNAFDLHLKIDGYYDVLEG